MREEGNREQETSPLPGFLSSFCDYLSFPSFLKNEESLRTSTWVLLMDLSSPPPSSPSPPALLMSPSIPVCIVAVEVWEGLVMKLQLPEHCKLLTAHESFWTFETFTGRASNLYFPHLKEGAVVVPWPVSQYTCFLERLLWCTCTSCCVCKEYALKHMRVKNSQDVIALITYYESKGN